MLPRARVRVPGRVYLIAAVNMAALGSLTAPAIVGLPAQIARFVPAEDRAGALALVVTCGAAAALAAAPIFGFLSDRTRGRLGRRRPWMLAGAVGTLAASIALVAAPSLLTTALAWVAMQALCNATLASADALFADVLSEPQRASASGLYAAAAFLGTLPALVLTALLPQQLVLLTVAIPAAALLITTACVLVVREPAAPEPPVRRLRGQWIRPGEAPGFLAVWLQRLLAQLAASLVLAYTLYFVMDRMARSEVEATPITSASTALGGAALMVASVVAGFLAARRGDYRPFLLFSMVGLAAAATLRGLTTEPALLWASAVLGGVAIGVFLAIDLALALRAIPAAKTGTYLGVLNVANATAQLAGPLLAVMLLGTGGPDPFTGGADNYATLYLAAAALSLCGLVCMPFIARVARAAPVSEPKALVRR